MTTHRITVEVDLVLINPGQRVNRDSLATAVSDLVRNPEFIWAGTRGQEIGYRVVKVRAMYAPVEVIVEGPKR